MTSRLRQNLAISLSVALVLLLLAAAAHIALLSLDAVATPDAPSKKVALHLRHAEELSQARWIYLPRGIVSWAPGPTDVQLLVTARITHDSLRHWTPLPESTSIRVPREALDSLGLKAVSSAPDADPEFRGVGAAVDSFTTSNYPVGSGLLRGDTLLMVFYSN